MTTFLLIRHGATDMLGKVLAGWMPGVHLNSEGTLQAAHLAERLSSLQIAALYSSPLERAQETAAPLAARLGIPVLHCEGAGEIKFGVWTGIDFETLRTLPQWMQFNTFRSGTRIPDGEMMTEVQARIVAALDYLRSRHPDGTVAVVSHGDVIKAALAYYAGIHLDFVHRLEISPASVSVLHIDEYGPLILRVNDTGVLPLAQEMINGNR